MEVYIHLMLLTTETSNIPALLADSSANGKLPRAAEYPFSLPFHHLHLCSSMTRELALQVCSRLHLLVRRQGLGPPPALSARSSVGPLMEKCGRRERNRCSPETARSRPSISGPSHSPEMIGVCRIEDSKWMRKGASNVEGLKYL